MQINHRLAEKRIAIETEVLKYGEAPAGIKEVFELCRGFERAYVEFINVGCSRVPLASIGHPGSPCTCRSPPWQERSRNASWARRA